MLNVYTTFEFVCTHEWDIGTAVGGSLLTINVLKILFENFILKFFCIFFWNFWKKLIFENYCSENRIFKNWFMSVGIRLIVFLNCNISYVRLQIFSLWLSDQRPWWVLSIKGIKCFVWVMHIRVMGHWSWPKNDHIRTAIDQISKISFSEK